MSSNRVKSGDESDSSQNLVPNQSNIFESTFLTPTTLSVTLQPGPNTSPPRPGSTTFACIFPTSSGKLPSFSKVIGSP